MFNSIGALIHRDPQVVRNEVADFMSLNREACMHEMKLTDWIHFSQESTASVDEYIATMRSPSVWGGGLELMCMTILYKIRIHIVLQGTDKEIVLGDAANSPVRIGWSGSHYVPLYP
jgi:hypothetical protein